MTRRIGAGLVFVALLTGCGRTGYPMPPDDYGIGVRLQAERAKEKEAEARARKEQEAREAAARQKEQEEPVPAPEEPILPDIRPLSGR